MIRFSACACEAPLRLLPRKGWKRVLITHKRYRCSACKAEFFLKRSRLPQVFVSHGRRDPVLPFAGAESIQTMLAPHGYTVDFHPFDGRHEIPREIVTDLKRFLFEN